MSLKLEFVDSAMKPGARMTTLCRQYGISRETGYKWLNRFKREGAEGLEERSRRPRKVPLATGEELVEAVLQLRQSYPRRGPKKLYVMLQRKYGTQSPSVATIARILRRFGQVRQRSRFRRLSLPETAPQERARACNEVWTVDFKGWWRTQNGQRCEPLTLRDAYSRYILAIRVMKSPSLSAVRAVFEGLFRQYGVPLAIQCDNGNPFISVSSRAGLTRLSAWWVALGIRVVRSRPGCPQDNGGHERMHRDMSEDLQAYPAGNLLAEQRACDRWRQEFNHVRPHEALAGKVPAELYRRSERRVCCTDYVYPPGWLVRSVKDNGTIKAGGCHISVGLPFIRQRVALEPIDNATHRLWYRNVDLGLIQLPLANGVIREGVEQFLRKKDKQAA